MEAMTACWAPGGPKGAPDQTTMRPVSRPSQIKMSACWHLTSASTQQERGPNSGLGVPSALDGAHQEESWAWVLAYSKCVAVQEADVPYGIWMYFLN